MDPGLGRSQRARYLAETALLLWPAPAKVTVGHRNGNRVVSEFFVLPNIADARLLLPLRERRAAAAVAHRYTEPRTLGRKVRAYAMSVATTTGIAQTLFRDRLRIELPDAGVPASADTIETLLGDVVGERVVVGLHLTRPRANRKPVLQALTADGTLRAVAKVATEKLTRTLVADEERNLRQLNARRLRSFEVPQVLDLRRWHDLLVLTLSPLQVDAPRAPVSYPRLAEVVEEIAATAPVADAALAGSSYARKLSERVIGLRQPYRDRLQQSLRRVLDDHGSQLVRFGAWHGDFTHTNFASLSGKMLVWDWERYQHDVPVGYDLLHHHVHETALAAGGDITTCVAALPDRTPDLLAPLGIERADALVLSKLYLVEIATRYVTDRQDETGHLRTMLPALLDSLADLCHVGRQGR